MSQLLKDQTVDEVNGVRGHLKIQIFDKYDNLVNEYQENNLVMDLARNSMQYLAGNVTGKTEPINQLRLGTRGVQGTQYAEAILPGSTGYHPEMTSLFQEDSDTSKGGYVYICSFDVEGPESQTFTSLPDKMLRYGTEVQGYSDISSGTMMTRTVNDRVITFEVTIPRSQGITPGQGGDPVHMPYSEAALYCGDRIFSMKTFPQKFKDEDSKIILTWSIIF